MIESDDMFRDDKNRKWTSAQWLDAASAFQRDSIVLFPRLVLLIQGILDLDSLVVAVVLFLSLGARSVFASSSFLVQHPNIFTNLWIFMLLGGIHLFLSSAKSLIDSNFYLLFLFGKITSRKAKKWLQLITSGFCLEVTSLIKLFKPGFC